jgi:hypothetical protein
LVVREGQRVRMARGLPEHEPIGVSFSGGIDSGAGV